MPKYTYLTFGGPIYNFHKAVSRICKEIGELEIFDEIIGKTELHIVKDEPFWSQHAPFFRANPRGFGYYLWKPYLIQQQVRAMDENDILVYTDCGCVINKEGKGRFLEYFELANNSPTGLLTFQLRDHKEKTWTKMDTIHHFQATDLLETDQILSGLLIVKKCPESVDLMDRWYEACCNYHLISDVPSVLPNDSTFRDHRHDQSVLSLLVKQSKGTVLADETWFQPWSTGIAYPVWAMRKRTG
jgi:hypothetical protein